MCYAPPDPDLTSHRSWAASSLCQQLSLVRCFLLPSEFPHFLDRRILPYSHGGCHPAAGPRAGALHSCRLVPSLSRRNHLRKLIPRSRLPAAILKTCAHDRSAAGVAGARRALVLSAR